MLRQSIDWQTVGLLSSTLFLEETAYCESIATWLIECTGQVGVVRLQKDDLRVDPRVDREEVVLRACRALLPGGYIVDIEASPERSPMTSVVSRENPNERLFVCLSRSADKVTVPGQTAENPRPYGYRRWKYDLACTEKEAPGSLAIGRLRKTRVGFELDNSFVPKCLYLQSHWRLVELVQGVLRLARQCLEASRENNVIPGDRLERMVTAMVPVTIVLDWRVSPQSYLERILIMLRLHAELLPTVSAIDERIKELVAVVKELEASAPKSPEDVVDWYAFLTGSENALRRLIDFYGAKRDRY